MKKPSDALFRLIKAMAPSEKRYFQQYAQRHVIGNRNNYLEMFQWLSGQEHYDENSIKEKLKGSGRDSHLPVLKRQLFELLLDCLGQYHRNAHPSEKIKRKIQAAGILKEKGLLTEAHRELKTARKAIHRYQLFIHLPELLQLEKSLLEQEVSRLPDIRRLNLWAEDWERSLDNLREEGRFAFYNLLMAKRHYQKVRLSDKKEDSPIVKIISSTEFTRGRESPSLLARMDYFRTLATYHFMAREPEAAYACNKAILDLLEEHPFLRELYPSRYVVALNNFLIDNFQLRNWQAVEEGLTKLRELPSRKTFKNLKGLKPKIFEQSTLLELNMLVSQKKYRQALTLAGPLETELSRFSSQIALHNKLTIQYLLAYTFFLNRKHNHSLSLLNEVLSAQRKGLMEELFRFARLLQLLLHYELGNYELLSYLISSVRRLHQDKQPVYQSESLILNTLHRLLNAADKKSKAHIFNSLRSSLEEGSLHVAESRFFEYLDILYWARVRPG